MRGANLFYSFYVAISAQSNKNYVRFPAIGDWGGSDYIIFPDGNTFTQEYGAASMDRLCGEKTCDFLLSLGDNFYTEGVKDIDDTRFHFTYELVYGKASEREVLKTLDFYQCLGNHDHRDNATAQVVYSNLMETTFKIPDLWYSFTIEKESFSFKMIMIDTMVMMNSRDTHQLPGYPDRDYRAEQNAWLEEELANSDADYLIVSGHHPVYSVSTHGPTSALVETLQPMLEKYHVDAYLCGHDHNMQHWFHKRTHYFISGMGEIPNPTLRNMNHPSNPAEAFDYFSILKPIQEELLGILECFSRIFLIN